jgi:hypothetical protein
MGGERDMIDIKQGIKRARRPLVHGRLWWDRACIRVAAQHGAAGDGHSGAGHPRAKPGAGLLAYLALGALLPESDEF